MREKGAIAFAKVSGDLQTSIAAMGKAYDLIKKGMGNSFLQTTAVLAARRLVVEMALSPMDKDIVSSFLSQGEGYAAASGQITGILSQMRETMEKDLADLTAKEEIAKGSFEGMVAAKSEVQANSEAIEAKMARRGELGVKIADAARHGTAAASGSSSSNSMPREPSEPVHAASEGPQFKRRRAVVSSVESGPAPFALRPYTVYRVPDLNRIS